MTCRCLPDPVTGITTEVDHLRLFRNRADLRWDFRVHEQILPAVKSTGGAVNRTDVIILHTGYVDPALRGRKLERDLRLLLMEQAERPDHPFILFNIGQIYQEQGRLEEALPLFRRSVEVSHPTDSIVRKLHALIAQCHNQLRQHREAVAACLQGKAVYPDDVEILFQEALALRNLRDVHGAVERWEQILTTPRGAYLASLNVGIRGYLTRYNLATAYQDLGRFADAEAQWKAILQERPDFQTALFGLAGLYLLQKRWAVVEDLARQLESWPEGKLEAGLLRGRVVLAQEQFASAQAIFAQLAAEFPTAVEPRVFLSYACLQGKDWDAAEKALHAVLALDPGNQEARSNLVVLGRQRGKEVSPELLTTLGELYESPCANASAHCPTLLTLAKECRHVTDIAMRGAPATVAFLHAQPEHLVCHAKTTHPQAELLTALAARTKFDVRLGDAPPDDIEETDLLFLDIERSHDPLAGALRRYAGKVRRYVVVPGTTKYDRYGETGDGGGIWPAVQDFLAQKTFRLKERSTDQEGLTILERL
jgi:tetratricopeptide (TPR) repeat protein